MRTICILTDEHTNHDDDIDDIDDMPRPVAIGTLYSLLLEHVRITGL